MADGVGAGEVAQVVLGTDGLGIAQVLPNLGYAACAALDAGRPAIYAASVLESFGQGLGTAAMLTMMMRLCDKEHAATEYALISAPTRIVPSKMKLPKRG